jgi:hypothetical protein
MSLKCLKSRFVCNLASQTLKSSLLKMILQEVERHMIGVLGHAFRKVLLFSHFQEYVGYHVIFCSWE